MGKIFYIMGKSSSGKDTIYNTLIKDEELDMHTIIGYTTRPLREGETQGIEYNFVTEEVLLNLENEGKVIEKRGYNTVYGMWYYATVDDKSIEIDKEDYLLIGTLESFEKVRKYYGNDKVIPIYVNVEDGIRIERALMREKMQKTPKYEELCRRFLADQKDFSNQKLKELGITREFENSDFKECCNEIKTFIISHR